MYPHFYNPMVRNPRVRLFLVGVVLCFVVRMDTVRAADQLIDVFVDIQTKVVTGDMIKARETAESLAFEEAVKQATVNLESPEKREAYLKSASRYVKTYQKLGERREGDILFVKYRVEVALPAAQPSPLPSSSASPAPLSSPSFSSAPDAGLQPESLSHQPVYQFEISLSPRVKPPLNSSSVVQFVKDTWNLPIQELRLSRGLIRFQVALKQPLPEVEAQLVQWLGERGTVKSSQVQEPKVDSEVLPAQPPVGQPAENPHYKPEIHVAPPLLEAPPAIEPIPQIGIPPGEVLSLLPAPSESPSIAPSPEVSPSTVRP